MKASELRPKRPKASDLSEQVGSKGASVRPDYLRIRRFGHLPLRTVTDAATR